MARINLKSLTQEIMLHDAFANTTKSQVEDVLRTVFNTITTHVIEGNDVAIPGFGKFSKFTSSTTERSKLKYTQAKAVKDAFVA